jgi:hypothetical protein
MRQMFILRPGAVLPTMVVASPSNLKPARKFFFGLLNEQTQYWKIITEVSLTKETSAGGQDFGGFNFRMVDRINPGDIEPIEKYRDVMKESLSAMPVVAIDATIEDELTEPDF